MPQHVYAPRRYPPTWWDRVLVHPFDHAVAVIAVIFGLLMAVLYPIIGVVPSPSFNNLSWVLNVGSGAALLSGGTLALTGLHWHGKSVTHGQAVELLGWACTSGGLLAVTLAFASGQSPAAWLIPGLIALGAITRWASLWLLLQDARKEARVVVQIESANGGRDQP